MLFITDKNSFTYDLPNKESTYLPHKILATV